LTRGHCFYDTGLQRHSRLVIVFLADQFWFSCLGEPEPYIFLTDSESNLAIFLSVLKE
jgi:hypothetical protein